MTMPPKTNCSDCGGKLSRNIPPGDDRLRDHCPDCGLVHYENPTIVAGCIITHKGKVQLVRRAIEPELGCWTLPAGYMEAGETLQQAAVREAWEEARARVTSQGLYLVFSLPQINQVYALFRGELTGFHVGDAGHESCNVGLFDRHEVPWDELAFSPLVRPALEFLFKDSNSGNYPVRNIDLLDLPLYDSGKESH